MFFTVRKGILSVLRKSLFWTFLMFPLELVRKRIPLISKSTFFGIVIDTWTDTTTGITLTFIILTSPQQE